MKFSESWLREWINVDINREQLSDQLTMAGLEVDDIKPIAGDFSGVKVGRVVSCGQHPDADKLQVTKVDVGDSELLDIVCGAANCRENLMVAVATVGAILPGDFKIKKAKLRGQPSHGMLCSYDELGIEIDSDGILELPEDAPIGLDIRDYLNLNDAMIDIDLTPNRADCLSILGLAREVSALNDASFVLSEQPKVAPSIDDQRTITLNAPKECPKFMGRVIKNIDISTPTPLWMIEKLRRSGIRSIDPIVDITNFVLIELGQPMHAFDLSKVSGNLSIRMAKPNESLTLLDGQNVTLDDKTLVVADEQQALAMAGVFGGEASGVTNTTTDILLECAFYNPESMLGAARRYGLHTESSHRFERGVDSKLQHRAMERATTLILEICGGEAGHIVEAISKSDMPDSKAIILTRTKLDKVLGHSIDSDHVGRILEHLHCKPEVQGDDWKIQVPSHRFDLSIEEDLIEEVARVYGYNAIPHVAPHASLVMRTHHEGAMTLSKVKQRMLTLGYQEAITYSFVDPKLQKKIYPEQEALSLPNPISEDMSVMRLSLFTGLLQCASYNQKRQQNRVRIFETGLKFVPQTGANEVKQIPVFSALISGSSSIEHWNNESAAVTFFDLKSDIESLFELTNLDSELEFKAVSCHGMHPGQSAEIWLQGKKVGTIGTVHPSLQKPFGLIDKAILCEIQLDALLQTKLPIYSEVSKFPANRRDIAIIVKQDVAAKNILNSIKKVGGNQLVGLNLFDIYQGVNIEEGFKSLAISMTIQDSNRTMEEAEITDIINQVVLALKTQFNALLRD